MQKRIDIRTLVTLSMFSALAYVSVLVFRINIQFLTFDMKDVFITIAAMFYGPIAGLVISLVTALLEMVTISSTGFYGALMNFVSSAAFACMASLMYKFYRNLKGAILGLITGVLSMTASMMIFNLLITPVYMGVQVSTVVELIPTLLLPFNLVKAVLNAALTLIFYKPISTALKSAKLIPGEANYTMNTKSIAVLISGIVIVIACFIIIFVVLGGTTVLLGIK